MAAVSRPSLFLPTIKCSSCNAELEISAMGDHVCSVEPKPTMGTIPESTKRDTSFTNFMDHPLTRSLQNGHSREPSSNGSVMSGRPVSPGPVKATRMMPPRIDPSVANRQFIRHNDVGSVSSAASFRAKSPAPSHAGTKSQYRIPPRSATSPLPRPVSPASPELLSFDCAFPPFPTSKQKNATHTSVRSCREGSMLRTNHKPDYSFAPVSPISTGGDSVMKRMNTIAPGPFDVRQRNGSFDLRASTNDQNALMRPTTPSSSASLDRPHSARPSTANTDTSGASSEDKQQTSPTGKSRPGPTKVPPPRPARGDGLFGTPDDSSIAGAIPSLDMFRFETRSQTFPVRAAEQNKSLSPAHDINRRPSEPLLSSATTRPALTASMRANTDTGVDLLVDSQMGKPQERRSMMKGLKITPVAPNPRAVQNEATKLASAPPVLVTDFAKEFSNGNPYHAPSDSMSSNDSSYESDSRTGSSESTPLSETSSQFSKQLPGVSPVDVKKSQDPAPMEEAKEAQLVKDAEAAEAAEDVKALSPARVPFSPQPPESPMDPAMQGGRFVSPSTSKTAHSESVGNTPRLEKPPVAKKNKGLCRGCGTMIQGKSVSSADGRLTGRYHKRCFVCQTCKEPFQTADFYVINNQPYCETHYHQLNNSVCQRCNRGIEGEYLETEASQKFHSACFTCNECRTVLRDGYFEMGGKFYCERHATLQRNFLGPGRKHPERRTTRLMVM
ncbi:hypothetical protein L228DRAFT_37523 [Xylona heveae TC161]|uniref:LIM zinc-binding domain-containing protein n=1 Tax=Xylona heveae (strain CBS 132557 / TC161) TaxID=1328760 RepID=A0A164ZX01_XYLHT|nr:hypothetical protein L228DRAFT_37523 [Xylona heveae TC161]KZF19640.1 hypothetical protein L228DRAFT_37523 [Xylona heveae TC161]